MKPTFQKILDRMTAPFLAAAPPAITLPQEAMADLGDLPDSADCAVCAVCAAPPPTWTLLRTSTCVGATGAVILGFSLHFYYVRELLVQFALFSLFFLLFALVVLSAFFVFYAGNRIALWTSAAPRAIVAFFRRFATR